MSKIVKSALAVVLVASAMPVAAEPGYEPRGFLRNGYSEKALGPGQWRVRGSSREQGGSVGVALYRAAELAAATGAAELRVTKQKVSTQTMTERNSGRQMSYHEATDLTVRAVRSAPDRTACDMADAAKCLTLPVAGLLATYGPRLTMPAALPGAAPVAPLPIMTRSPYQQAVADLLKRHPEMRAPAPVR